MKRRILALLLPAALLLTLAAQALNAQYADIDETGALLPRSRVYREQFADVASDSWYHDYVALGYEYALFDGRGAGFEPESPVKLSELITLSARLRAVWADETISDAPGAWYARYVRYLSERGLLEPTLPAACDVPATRAQLAAVFAATLPESCFDSPYRALVDEAYASGRFITDVTEQTPYRGQILLLYARGLLAGTDASGSYQPEKTTTRAETAAVVMRIVLPSLRVTPDWTVPKAPLAPDSLAALVSAPASVTDAPSFEDRAAVEALVRQMLADGSNVIDLNYPKPITKSEAAALSHVFSDTVKTLWCEQMYNSVECVYFLNSGEVHLYFCATAFPRSGGESAAQQLAQYREDAFRRAVEVREALWEDGTLCSGMTQYEIARVYFQWLCEHCVYDSRGASSDASVSHLAYSALVNGSAVCDGYTGAYNLLLRLEGIECSAALTETHIWTVAKLDGKTYHIDVTWGDQDGGIDWVCFAMDDALSEQVHKK